MLWIVGKCHSEFRNYLASNNIAYGLFWDISVPIPDDVSGNVVPIDFNAVDDLQAQLHTYEPLQVSAIIVAGYENYVLPASLIATYFGASGPSLEAALAATDKAVMRECFMRADPNLTPDFAEVSRWEDVLEFMKTHSYPVMLKPASLMKSLLITKNDDLDSLRHNFDVTVAEIQKFYTKHSVAQQPKIVIEEFLQGSMHTVAAFADKNGEVIIASGVADLITGAEIGHNDNFLYCRTMPSRLPEHIQNSLHQTAITGMKALGLTSCPAHVEIILTGQGPKIIEIGARLGGYRPRMYEYSLGIDLQKMMIDNALGLPIALSDSPQKYIAVYELFPDTEGSFAEVLAVPGLQKLPSLRHFSVKKLPGDLVGRSSQGFKATAVIILGNSDKAQFEKDTAYVRENVKIILID